MRSLAAFAALVVVAAPALAQPQPAPATIEWAGDVTVVQRQGKYWHTTPARPGHELTLSGVTLGRDVDVLVRFRAYAPGVTDVSEPDRGVVAARLEAAGLRVESPWLPGGAKALTVNALDRGPYGHDAEVEWSLADHRPGAQPNASPTGRYPVTIRAGAAVVGSLVLVWEADPNAVTAAPPAPAPLETPVGGAAEVLHRDHFWWHVEPLAPGATLALDGGTRDDVDLVVRLNVEIRGVTDNPALPRAEVQARLARYAPEVRGTWIPGGAAPLVLTSVATGPNASEAVLEWSAFGYDRGASRSEWPATGRYRVGFVIAGAPALDLELDWTAPAPGQ